MTTDRPEADNNIAPDLPPGIALDGELRDHSAAITRFAWSPSGKYLCSPSIDGKIRIWDVQDKKLLNTVDPQGGKVWKVAWTENAMGKYRSLIAAACEDGGIRLYNAADPLHCEEIAKLQQSSSAVYSLVWSRDGKYLAACGRDKTIGIWGWADNQWTCHKELHGHTEGVNTLDWCPYEHGSRYLVSGSADKSVRFWDVDSATLRSPSPYLTEACVNSVAWAPKDDQDQRADSYRYAAAGNDAGWIYIRCFRNAKVDRQHRAHQEAVIRLHFDRSGLFLASKSRDNTVKIWETLTWSLVATIPVPGIRENDPTRADDWHAGTAFHPSEPLLATLGGGDNIVQIFRLDRLRLLQPLDQQLEGRLIDDPAQTETAAQLIRLRCALGLKDDAGRVYDIRLTAYKSNDAQLEMKDLRKKESLLEEAAAFFRSFDDHTRYLQYSEQLTQTRSERLFRDNRMASISIRELEANDLEFFGDFRWKLDPHMNILIGRNGYGKSYLLRALVALLQGNKQIVGELLADSGAKAFLRVTISKDELADASPPPATVFRKLGFEESFGKVPLLAIPDIRYLDRSASGFSGETVGAEDWDLSRDGARVFLQEQPYLNLVSSCFYKLCIDYLDCGKSLDLPSLQLAKGVMERLTGDTFKFESIERVGDNRFEVNVSYNETPRSLPLQKVSQGTLSVLAIVSLIHSYLCSLHGGKAQDTDTNKKVGIVVIDEVDAHLHPRWQRLILPLLRKIFPNVQFVVTAQNPLVIAGAEEYQVAVLRRFGDRPNAPFVVDVLAENFIGTPAGEIYRKVFGIEEKDEAFLRLKTLRPAFRRDREQLQRLTQKRDRSESEDIRLRQLEDESGRLQRWEEIVERWDKDPQEEEIASLRQQLANCSKNENEID